MSDELAIINQNRNTFERSLHTAFVWLQDLKDDHVSTVLEGGKTTWVWTPVLIYIKRVVRPKSSHLFVVMSAYAHILRDLRGERLLFLSPLSYT